MGIINTKRLLSKSQVELLKYTQSLFNKPIYLVGGAVRDIIIGTIPKDYDFCSILTTDEVKQQLKGIHKTYLIGERHGTIGFKVGSEMIEITTFRTESYIHGSRQPKVEFVTDISEDLSRRDFTINAMAIRCDNYKLIDPFGGANDIGNGILKTVGDSKLRFKEDPLRILRAVRIASKYSLNIEAKTADRIYKMANKLLEISKERWVQEIDKILMLDGYNLTDGLHRLWVHGIFEYIIPELHLQFCYKQNSRYHDFMLHQHTINVVKTTPCKLNLRWAALLHDIAKPFVRTENKNGYSNYINHEILGADIVERLARHLKFSNERRAYIVDLVKNHLNEDCELREYDNKGKLNK
jgi:tRNA nucleotidyltransferase (CCA-adding enzyme)